MRTYLVLSWIVFTLGAGVSSAHTDSFDTVKAQWFLSDGVLPEISELRGMHSGRCFYQDNPNAYAMVVWEKQVEDPRPGFYVETMAEYTQGSHRVGSDIYDFPTEAVLALLRKFLDDHSWAPLRGDGLSLKFDNYQQTFFVRRFGDRIVLRKPFLDGKEKYCYLKRKISD